MPLFDGSESEPKDLGQVIRQAIGLASVCWVEQDGERVFDDTTANALATEVEDWVDANYEPKQPGSGAPDVVHVYKDEGGQWRWVKRDGGNHVKTASSGEAFSSQAAAMQAAHQANTGATVRIDGPHV